MEVGNPLSARANAFSIASLVPQPGEVGSEAYLAAYGYHNQINSSMDCYYNWGQNTGYAPGLKAMEGENSWIV